MKSLALCLIGTASLVACAGSDDLREIPEELAELRTDALRCERDSAFVPVENSEHCVAVAENLFSSSRMDCEGKRTQDCYLYELARADIFHLYHSAVIDGLLLHGATEGVQKAVDDEIMPRFIYYDGEWMRSRFIDCLKAERQGLAEKGLQPATSIAIYPLREGQLCFRRGYPEFNTKPLDIS